MIIEQTTLYYQEGTSDKVYQAWVEERESSKEYVVNFAFGRRGYTMQTGTKTRVPTSKNQALGVYTKLVDSKIAKGYEVGTPYSGGLGARNTPCQYRMAPQEASSNIKEASPEIYKTQPRLLPQLLNPVEDSKELEELLENNEWVAQQKFDGRRMLVKIEITEKECKDNEFNKFAVATAYNRRGLACGAPESILKEAELLAKITKKNFILDGEAIGEEFFVFDILEYEESTKKLHYDQRLEILEKIFKNFCGSSIFLVETHYQTLSKKTLFQRLKNEKAEGVVFKRLQSNYESGRPASRGPQRKFKFVETLSAIVTTVNSKRSVALGLVDNEGALPTPVGNVTVPVNHTIPNVGDIVEVRYLYANKPSNALYQPVYLGKREDIPKEDCTLDQLKYKS